MSDYNFDPNESSFLYPFVRDLAMDKHVFSKETIQEIEDCFNCLEKWFAMFIKREQISSNGEYKPMFRYGWVPKNKTLTSEDYLWNDVEHLMNESILEDWIQDEIVYYEEVEVEHNHGPCPSSCYGPWHDVITYSTEWSFYEWDASQLHDFLRKFKNSTRKEKYELISHYV